MGFVYGRELASRISEVWLVRHVENNKSNVYGAYKRGQERRKGKKHHSVAKGLRLRIPLCNLTVFNSYILIPRRPLCQSALAPSWSHLAAALWGAAGPLLLRDCIHHRPMCIPLPSQPPCCSTPDVGRLTGTAKRQSLAVSKWDKLCFSHVPYDLFFFLQGTQ